MKRTKTKPRKASKAKAAFLKGKGAACDTAYGEENQRLLSSIKIRKAKTHKGRKILDDRKGQVNEPAKQSLFLRSTNCNESARQLLQDLHMIRKPLSLKLARKQQDLDLFRDVAPLEFLCQRNLCSLFCYGSTTKSRPARLIMGRTFEDHLLDMYEVHFTEYKPLQLFANARQPILGCKPLVIAQGADFNANIPMQHLRDFLLDFFSVGSPFRLLASGIEQLITLTAVSGESLPNSGSNPRILFRRYRMDRAAAEPNVTLEEVGPRFTLVLDRHVLPNKDLWRAATALPKEVKVSRTKNVSTTLLGESRGRVHVGVQDFKKLYTRHHHPHGGNKKKRVSFSTSTDENNVGGASTAAELPH